MKSAEAVEPIVIFARTHRLRLKRDECNDLNIVGKHGDIYDYGDGKHFSVTVMAGVPYWNAQRRTLIAAGCRITQNGDGEGTALFDPANPVQVQAALKAIQNYRKRELTEDQRAILKVHGAQTRFKPVKTQSKPAVDPKAETPFEDEK